MIKAIGQAKVNFESFPNPTLKYGLGMSGNFISGWPESLSGAKSTISDLQGIQLYESIEEAPSHIRDKVGTVIGQKDKFDAFHISNILNGNVKIIYVKDYYPGKKRNQDKNPICLKTLFSESACLQHILVFVESGNRVRIIEDLQSTDSVKFISHYVEVITEDNAEVNYTVHQNLAKGSNYISKRSANVGSNALVVWNESNFGSTKGFVSTHSDLLSEGATSYFSSMYFSSLSQNLDILNTVSHKAPRTISRLFAKGILADSSKSIHRAKIQIEKGNPGCTGEQESHILLLSDNMELNTVPSLEIGNEEVKCSHGVKIFSLDESDFFYLMSRGLRLMDAYKLIVQNFFVSLFPTLPNEAHDVILESCRNKIEATKLQ